MSSLCVFCGSSPGSQVYQDATKRLGEVLAHNGVEVIYGGGKVGLMGLLADAVLADGGRVVGVIPQFLIDLEVAHTGLSELIVVRSMHDRKAEMAARADAFVALPGGFGTLEEFFEVLTWLQLGLHQKPCVLLNIDGFFTPLINFLQSARQAGFIPEATFSMLTVCDTIEELLRVLSSTLTSDGFHESLI